MYKLEILTLTNELIDIKKFNTIQELQEFYYEYQINNKILVKNEWYRIASKMKFKDDYKFYVIRSEI